MRARLRVLVLTGLLSASYGPAPAEDWPQWRGPRQDGISRETGLASKWPEKGPPELWRIPLGAGFSSVSVVGGRAYTMYGTPEGEFVAAVDADSGKLLWKVPSGPLFRNSYGDGPRATPAVDEGRVYSLGAAGSLLCLEAETGKKAWGYNVLEKFAAEPPEFGLSASPVVMGNMLVVVVGTKSLARDGGGQAQTSEVSETSEVFGTVSKSGRSLTALDKSTGAVLWTSLSDKAGYSTPIHIKVDGVPQIVVLMGEALVNVSPKDGRELWRQPWKTTLDANVATPIFHGNRLFVSTGYGTGCGMFELSAKDGKPAVKELWKNKNMKNYFSTSVLLDGFLYGFDNTVLVCMDFQTGKVTWRERGFNRGSLLAADGKLVIYGERAVLALAEARADKYREISKAQVLSGKTWTVPTLADGKLFVRNEESLACFDLRGRTAR